MKTDNVTELRRVAFLLTIIGGILEIFSYKLKGGVFATAITGNIVLMVYHAKNLSFEEVLKYLLPISCFITGVSISEILKLKAEKLDIKYWRNIIILFEIIVFIIIPYIASDGLVAALISLVSGMQVQAFRRVYGKAYMSTMCTGNTRLLIESIINKRHHDVKIYSFVITGFVTGVILGDILISLFNNFAIYFCALILIVVTWIINRKIKN
ncbi:YoaK family protein [Pseudostreptobacillus hongkongensis]|uniref:YoaK family protein n=1 Tax=Pseudostreptobacillus hongkongensis TaxID=1162717 RepID=UPI0028D74ED5|nr:YoaK family protein [Pseudostreptobacillus hongkongensis]